MAVVDEDYAVVFSGGGALGSWEVGCLGAVIDAHGGRLPSVVSGASAGAINAAGLAAGMTVDQLGSTWGALTNGDIYVVRSFRSQLILAALGSLWGKKSLLSSATAQVKTVQSIFDTAPLENTLRRILQDRENAFLSSPMAFAISTTKLADSQPELFYKMPIGHVLPDTATQGRYAKAWTIITGLTQLLQALKGTSALPILFPPMEGRFDGGVLLNQPISPAIRLGATNLYVFIPSVEQIGDTRDMLAIGNTMLSTWLAMSLTSQIEQIKLRNQIRLITKDPPLRVCVVRPGLDLGQSPGVGLLSFGLKVDELIAMGRKSAEERLSRFDPSNPNTWY
jgi:predicted acylesterase/phospholipase RssA